MKAKFTLTKGTKYQVINTKFTNNDGMISCNSSHYFLDSFPCYDARFHGVSNPEDYICYRFKLPKQLGIVTFYQFQIIEVVEA